MATTYNSIKSKPTLLQLASELDNISKACRIAGVSRRHFYDIKDDFENGGIDAFAPRPRIKAQMPNKASAELENKILEFCLKYPTYGQLRVSNELRKGGEWISPGGVREIWKRHNMTTRYRRLLRLEQASRETGFELTPEVREALERTRDTYQEIHVESKYPGYLLCQDLFYVGTLKGIGRIYMQAVIDSFCSYGFAKLYTMKTPITSADVMNDRVLPFYERHEIPVEHILTDNGREYCGKSQRHYYEAYLEINGIEHRTTKIATPRTNGFAERFHQTIFNEFFKVAFRKKFYPELDELQKDLDEFMNHYNEERTHQGYRLNGRTPKQGFEDGLKEMESSMKEAA